MMSKFTFFILLTIIFMSDSFSQYQMSLQNDLQTGPNTYEFDVYMNSSSGTINVTSIGLVFGFNTGIIGAGSLSFSYIAGTSDLSNPPNIGVGIVTDGSEQNFTAGTNPGSDNVTTTSVRVGRFRISNSVTFPTQSANVSWNFAGNVQTEINVNNLNVTNPSNHSNSLTNTALPVELISFTAINAESKINLKWQTKTEVDNYGFEIERASLNQQSAVRNLPGGKASPKFEKIGFIPGSGNSNSTKDYSFADNNPSGGSRFAYRLKQVDTDGKFQYSEEIAVDFVPEKFALFQNYPNPFNPSTTIKFAMPKAGNVTLAVYSLLGEKIKDLFSGFKEPGIYNYEFQAKELGSGTYIYRLQADDFVQVRKMMLIK